MTTPQADPEAEHHGRMVKAESMARANAVLTAMVLAVPILMVAVLGVGWALHTVLAW